MTTESQVQGLDQFARWGFTLAHPDDHMVELLHEGELVARFSQSGATKESLQKECTQHLVIEHGWGFAGRPCCACKETITGDDTKASAIMLQKKAKWDYPTWGNGLDGIGGRAIALVCGKCLEQNRQPEYALKLNGDDWADPKDIELVPLVDLEDAG